MSLLTRAERTRYEETSRHADVMAFIEGLRALDDPRLHIDSFGQTPEGRELPLLVLSARGIRTAEESRARGLPVVLVQNGIHAGEVEGKEASLMLVRDILANEQGLGFLLENLTLLVVPLFNADGNEALDPGNRRLHLPKLEGQVGPGLVGTRVNASGVNLNRDYMRQEALEMRLMQNRVCQVWEPELTIDNHATNGSIHRFSMTYDVPHTIASGRPEPIEWMRDRLLPVVTAQMRQRHAIDTGWYGNFVEDERVLDMKGDADPNSLVREGWMTYPHHPRFGSNYRGLTSRMDLLLECYSYIPFSDRVRTAYHFMVETLSYVASHSSEVIDVIQLSIEPRGKIAVRSKLEPSPAPVEVLTRRPRTLEGEPTSVTIPHFSNFVGATVVDRPRGYIVPPRVAAHLRQHGLQTRPAVPCDVQVAEVEGFGEESGRKILEAARVGELQVSWKKVSRKPPPGYEHVGTDQPLGAIAVYFCEPESDDGAIENGLIETPQLGDEFPIWRIM